VDESSRGIIYATLWMGRGKELQLETQGAPGETQYQLSPNTGKNRVGFTPEL
jgi:hypothetical protein